LRLSGHWHVTDLSVPDLGRCSVSVWFDDPVLIAGFLEVLERLAQLLDGLEASDPEQVFLERADEALSTAMARRLAHKGRRAFETEEGALILEVVADLLTAMVMAELEACGDLLGKGTEALTHRLLDRLQRLEAVSVP
jgi:hypothetical protein